MPKMNHDAVKTRTPLSIKALLKKLEKLGASIDETTIQKWARQGIIPASIPQQPDKGKVGHRKKAGNKGGRHALYPPEAFEDAAAAWCVVEAARKRSERIPTLGTIRKTMIYTNQVLNAYTTDYHSARALRNWDYVPQPHALSDHLAQNEIISRLFESTTTSDNEKGLVEDIGLISADYHPHIVSYICGWLKAVKNCDLRTPVIISFVWQSPRIPPDCADDYVIEASPFGCDCLSLVNLEDGYGEVSLASMPTYLGSLERINENLGPES